MEQSHISFEQVVSRGCGLDVHQENVVATIRGNGLEEQTRTFSTFTSSLRDLVAWLEESGITHVAMESTGVYWKPVFNILEPHFELILVNARHIKYVPGHKTDRNDSAWIAKLLLSGLLKGSFIPPQYTRELRELYRYKRKVIGQRSSEYNRLQNILETANIKLSTVVSDVFGVSGWSMITAIIEGEQDPMILANLAKGRLKIKKQELILALEGHLNEHHRFMLSLSKTVILQLNDLLGQVDNRIDQYLKKWEEEVKLLQTIPGVQKQTATAILAEIGTDMHAFPNQHHLASWCGLCPGNNESAGKKKSERINHGNRSLKTALVEAAWAAAHTKDTYLKRKYYTLSIRRGKKRALIAISHKILIAAYFILKNRVPYMEPDNQEWLKKRKQAQINNYLRRLRELEALPPSQ
ncbi:IS110 family transposase [[Flexibacter] sp. ATCC 35208]|uniref:IS110 family transposase n=2 Tax=[Flexibacter] sp. ATCC 35208 TaxID=1936242 RepID=UPI0009CDE369|nr:IS110 family transposase [[Flexibacter] sp. ATCC 35208]OMP75029.1 IS110 family transposase [[Flexibacter] sp. ATCC 35208]